MIKVISHLELLTQKIIFIQQLLVFSRHTCCYKNLIKYNSKIIKTIFKPIPQMDCLTSGTIQSEYKGDVQ